MDCALLQLRSSTSNRNSTMFHLRRRDTFYLCLSAMAATSGLSGTAASAQGAYPSQPIRMVVPFSPGGGIDVLGRTIGQKLQEHWKVGVITDNRPGASGNIGTELVASAPPDGYTYLMTVNTIVITPSLMKGVRFNPMKDFAPVSTVALGSLALVTRPGFPATSVKDLVAMAKASPGKVNYGSPGNGTPHHLAMELFKSRAGFSAVHIPYKGSGTLVSDLLAGQVDVAFVPVHQALQYVRAGKMQMLAAGGAQRTAVTPDVPSLEEASGTRDVDVDMWYALYLPAATSPEIVAAVNREVNAILKMPDVRRTLSTQGLQATGSTPEALAELTKKDFARWAQVIRAANLQAD